MTIAVDFVMQRQYDTKINSMLKLYSLAAGCNIAYFYTFNDLST